MTLSIFDAQLVEKVLAERYATKEHFNKNDLYNILNEMTKVEQYFPTGKKRAGQKYYMFKWFVRYCLYRNLSNVDTCILITGRKGSGKSSFGIMLCREWCNLLGINFSSKKHIAYSNSQMRERIENLPLFSPLLGDESVNYISAAEWNKVDNRELRKKMAQVRTKHFFFILCWPMKISKVEKTYLDSFVNYWIHIVKRGSGVIFVPDENPYGDPWKLKLFEKMGGITEFTGVDKVVKKLKSHQNFWQIITVPKPSDKFYANYLVVREKNVYNSADVLGNTSRQDVIRSVLIKVFEEFMQRESSLTMKRLLPYIKREYNVDLKESELNGVIDDCNMLLDKLKKEKFTIDTFESETDWSATHKTSYDDNDGDSPNDVRVV